MTPPPSSIEAIASDLEASERGFVLGALLSGGSEALRASAALAPPSGDRCARALAAVASLERSERARLMSLLARDALAPIPAGIENVHTDTIREVLCAESAETVGLVATNAPSVLQKVCQDVLGTLAASPTSTATPAPTVAPNVFADLQRAVFATIVAVAASPPGARSERWAHRLLTLASTEILVEVTAAGAELLGTSLRGAEAAVVKRAAAHVGAPWSQQIVEAARREGVTDPDGATRSQARALVAATPAARDPLQTLERLGARALGDRLSREDPDVVVALAQRLPADLRRELLRAATSGSGPHANQVEVGTA